MRHDTSPNFRNRVLSLQSIKSMACCVDFLPFLEAAWCMQQIDQHLSVRGLIKASGDGSSENAANDEQADAVIT